MIKDLTHLVYFLCTAVSLSLTFLRLEIPNASSVLISIYAHLMFSIIFPLVSLNYPGAKCHKSVQELIIAFTKHVKIF